MPEPRDEPDAVALAAGAPDLAVAALTSLDALPVRWFPCVESGVGAAVRAHVLTALNAWAIDTDTIADAMVLVSELVTNVRDHTASESLGVRVRVTSDRIVLAIVEENRSSPPGVDRLDPAAPRTAAPGVPPIDRGRGLQILDSMASEWGFVRTGGVNTAWFALPATPPGTPAREPEIRRF